jgi:cardiolipin synthase
LLLGTYHGPVAAVAKPIAWAFTLWGVGLYLWAGVVYVRQYRVVTRAPAR